jgi:hypothetical protein
MFGGFPIFRNIGHPSPNDKSHKQTYSVRIDETSTRVYVIIVVEVKQYCVIYCECVSVALVTQYA